MAGEPQISDTVDPLNVKRKDLAIILGVSEETVRTLTLKGVLKSHGTAKFLLPEAVSAYLEYKSQGSALADQAKARQKVEDERYRKLKRENDEADKNLLPTEEVRKVFSQALIVLRQNVSAVGRRVDAAVAASTSKDDCRRIINKETDQSLHACEKCLTDLGGLGGLDTAGTSEGQA